MWFHMKPSPFELLRKQNAFGTAFFYINDFPRKQKIPGLPELDKKLLKKKKKMEFAFSRPFHSLVRMGFTPASSRSLVHLPSRRRDDEGFQSRMSYLLSAEVIKRFASFYRCRFPFSWCRRKSSSRSENRLL